MNLVDEIHETPTPVDLGCKVYRITTTEVLAFQQAKREQGTVPLERCGTSVWFIDKTGIRLERQFLGLTLRSIRRYGEATRLGTFLSQGGLCWRATAWQKLSIKLMSLYPELIVLATMLALILLIDVGGLPSTPPALASIPPVAPSQPRFESKAQPKTIAVTKPIAQPTKRPWVLSKTPLPKRSPATTSTSMRPLAKTTQALIGEANAAFLQGRFKSAQDILEKNRLTLTTDLGRNLLAEIYYTYAYQYFYQQNYLPSLQASLQALQYQAQHDRAQRLKAQIVEHAKTLFMEAYVCENLEPKVARQKYNEVITLLAPLKASDPGAHYSQRALQRIKKL